MCTTFKYFAYGSNLCAYRLILSSPSLKGVGIGKLPCFALEFARNSERWKGGVATIRKSDNPHDCVWGVVWEIALADLPALDHQEGVSQNVYRPFEVNVITPEKEELKCRTYQLTDLGGKHKYSDPSPQYHSLILEGAKHHSLPAQYIEMLQGIKTNDNTEETQVMRDVLEMRGRF